MLKSVHAKCGYLLDPHTAVALRVARSYESFDTPMITLATAHASKFPTTVQESTGVCAKLPAWVTNLMEGKERFAVLESNQSAVEAFIVANIT